MVQALDAPRETLYTQVKAATIYWLQLNTQQQSELTTDHSTMTEM